MKIDTNDVEFWKSSFYFAPIIMSQFIKVGTDWIILNPNISLWLLSNHFLLPIRFVMFYDRVQFWILTGLIWNQSWGLVSLLQGGRNNFFPNTFGFFFLVFGQILAGDALARFLNHESVGSKARLGHDAPKRLYEIEYAQSEIEIEWLWIQTT